jgi:hypothetical protein
MEPVQDRVAIVFDPAFGDALRVLVREQNVWIADTPENQAAVRRLYLDDGPAGPLHDVTTFIVPEGIPPAVRCMGVLRSVGQQRAELTQSADYAMVEIIGEALSSELAAGFAEQGFSRIEPTPRGFVASRAA